MTAIPPNSDHGCLICGRGSDVVPVGVYSEWAGEGERRGERVWLCEECAQVEEYARAFVFQAREQFSLRGGTAVGDEALPEASVGFSYRIVSPILRARTDAGGVNLFHAWTIDI